MTEKSDPRVLFAAERTLMAWNRTGISLMAFGFAVERFGLYLAITLGKTTQAFQRDLSFLGGLGFILLGVFIELFSAWQQRTILKSICKSDIPNGYNSTMGMLINCLIGGMGIMLTLYLIHGYL